MLLLLKKRPFKKVCSTNLRSTNEKFTFRVGNCVGKRNYRYFYFFLVSLGIHCVFIFSCAISHLVLLAKDDRGGGSNSFASGGSGSRKETSDFIEAVKDSPASIIVCIICFFSMWSILGLAGNISTIWEHRLTNLL